MNQKNSGVNPKVHWSLFCKGTSINTQRAFQVKCADLSERGDKKGVSGTLIDGLIRHR